MKKPIFSFAVVICCVVLLLATGCSQGQSNTFDLASILIGANDLPSGWFVKGVNDVGVESYRSLDSVGIVFNPYQYPEKYGFRQNIYRFDFIWKAQRDFATELRFYERFYYVPKDWKYESDLFDESYFSCRQEPDRCFWVARYKNIVIDFQGPLNPDLMSLQDFESIAKPIELKVSQVLLIKK